MLHLASIVENAGGEILAAAVLAAVALLVRQRKRMVMAGRALLNMFRRRGRSRTENKRRNAIEAVLTRAELTGQDVPVSSTRGPTCTRVTFHPSGTEVFYFRDLACYKRELRAGNYPPNRSFRAYPPGPIDSWTVENLRRFLDDNGIPADKGSDA